jgi:hypothetical protein
MATTYIIYLSASFPPSLRLHNKDVEEPGRGGPNLNRDLGCFDEAQKP